MQSTKWTKKLQKLDDIKKWNRDRMSKKYKNKLEMKER